MTDEEISAAVTRGELAGPQAFAMALANEKARQRLRDRRNTIRSACNFMKGVAIGSMLFLFVWLARR